MSRCVQTIVWYCIYCPHAGSHRDFAAPYIIPESYVRGYTSACSKYLLSFRYTLPSGLSLPYAILPSHSQAQSLQKPYCPLCI